VRVLDYGLPGAGVGAVGRGIPGAGATVRGGGAGAGVAGRTAEGAGGFAASVVFVAASIRRVNYSVMSFFGLDHTTLL